MRTMPSMDANRALQRCQGALLAAMIRSPRGGARRAGDGGPVGVPTRRMPSNDAKAFQRRGGLPTTRRPSNDAKDAFQRRERCLLTTRKMPSNDAKDAF